MPLQLRKRKRIVKRKRKVGGSETRAQIKARLEREVDRLHLDLQDMNDSLDDMPAHLEGSPTQRRLIDRILILQRYIIGLEERIANM